MPLKIIEIMVAFIFNFICYPRLTTEMQHIVTKLLQLLLQETKAG